MEKKELSFTELVEIHVALTSLSKEQKEFVVNQVYKLNNAVRDYENRIKNAINQLER